MTTLVTVLALSFWTGLALVLCLGAHRAREAAAPAVYPPPLAPPQGWVWQQFRVDEMSEVEIESRFYGLVSELETER